MNWRSRLAMFILTPPEQRLIAGIVLALLLFWIAKHHQVMRSIEPAAPNATPSITAPPPSGDD